MRASQGFYPQKIANQLNQLNGREVRLFGKGMGSKAGSYISNNFHAYLDYKRLSSTGR